MMGGAAGSYDGRHRQAPERPARFEILAHAAAHVLTEVSVRTLVIEAMAFALSVTPVYALPPDNVDPSLTPWFNSLKQPGTGAECCSIADCRTAEVRRDSQGYEVKIDHKWHVSSIFWLRVPAERILDEHSNPTGRAVLCYTPEAGILCFVPPPES